MTQATSIFATLSPTVRSKLAFLKLPPAWSYAPALAGFRSPAEVLEASSAPVPTAARRPVLSALLVLAPKDRLAAEVLMAALSPGFRSVAAELTRKALETARDRGWRVVPACSYAAAYLAKHPQEDAGAKQHLSDLLDEALEESFPASDPPAVGGS